jgi:polyisoprenoid-binding protein YceI
MFHVGYRFAHWAGVTGTFQVDTARARQYVGLDFKVPSDARKVTCNMLGSDILDVARYPRAVYSITSVQPVDSQPAGQPGRYQIEGQFTLHGTTQPVQFVAVVESTDRPGALRMRGMFSILQTAYCDCGSYLRGRGQGKRRLKTIVIHNY